MAGGGGGCNLLFEELNILDVSYFKSLKSLEVLLGFAKFSSVCLFVCCCLCCC